MSFYKFLLISVAIFFGLFCLVKTTHAANNIYLDEVRFYSRVLSVSEIAEQYRAGAGRLTVNSPPSAPFGNSGLVGYWSFDGAATNWTSATTGTTNDLSGNGNTGTLTNMSRSSSPVPGKSGQALSFDGVDDYVNNGTNLITGTAAYTLSAWAKWRSMSNYGVIITIGNGAYGQQAAIAWLTTVQGGTSNSIGCAGYGQNYGTGITDQTNWHHIVMTSSGGATQTINCYVDGVQKIQFSLTNNLPPFTAVRIGAGDDNGTLNYWYKGLIDEVRIYSRALSQSEVQQLYQAGVRKVKF